MALKLKLSICICNSRQIVHSPELIRPSYDPFSSLFARQLVYRFELVVIHFYRPVQIMYLLRNLLFRHMTFLIVNFLFSLISFTLNHDYFLIKKGQSQ